MTGRHVRREAQSMIIRCLQIYTQWKMLRAAVDELELEILNADLPRPTPRMCKLLIVAEDHRFDIHPGVDPWALCRAAWKTYFCDSRQGGSTIAMQLVRTISGRREMTWQRKIVEILLAVRLSRYVPKDRLPILYLWCAYYGWNMNNFSDACYRLQLDPVSSTISDEAQLIARLKYPQPKGYDAVRIHKIRQRGIHIISLAQRQNFRKPAVRRQNLEIQHETI